LTGQVTFTLNRAGRLESLTMSATSLVPEVDSALMTAVRQADAAKAFVGVRAGRYTMSLSSANPDPYALAIDLTHISVPVLALAKKAAIATDAPAPALPVGSGIFRFVVDERGHAIPATLMTVMASSPDFAIAVGRDLDSLRFEPAVAGTCPIKQIVEQPFRVQDKVKQQ
jgi:hypothetical protein